MILCDRDKPCLQQLMDVYDPYQVSVVGVQRVPDQDIPKYGIVEPKEDISGENVMDVEFLGRETLH